MANDNYYFMVNNEVCCGLQLFIHDKNHPFYSKSHLHYQQLQQQQRQELCGQEKSTPSVANLFSPLPPLTPTPNSVLSAAGDDQLRPYSTVTSSLTDGYATTLIQKSQQHQLQSYHTHPEAAATNTITQAATPSSPCLPPDASSLSELCHQRGCPNVVISYDGTFESFSTLFKDGVKNTLLPGPNTTWDEIRQIAFNGTDTISVLCNPAPAVSVEGVGATSGADGIFMDGTLNNSSAITSAYTYTPNISSLLQNLSDVNFSIFSEHEYIELYLGKRYLSNAAMVTLMTIYSIIFFTGVLGNVCTCIVINRNRFLHTATNYYLFSLAISDVLTLLLALPQEMATIWEAYPFHFGSGFCIIKSFVSEMTAYASVLTITAFTIDRYVAICHPLRSQMLSSLSRAVKIIFIIWLVACACALPYPIHTRTYHELLDPCTLRAIPESFVCNLPARYRSGMKYMFQFSTFAFFVVPMVVITIMYAMIGLTLMRTDQFAAGNKTAQAALAAAKAKRAVLKMLVAVVIAFFVCWAPFHAQRLMTMYIAPEDWTEELLTVQTHIFYISGVLYFVSSTVNPFLYNVMSKRYRKAFKHTLARCINGKNTEFSETSIFRSTPRSTTVTTYTQHRLVVQDRSANNGDLEANSSTTL